MPFKTHPHSHPHVIIHAQLYPFPPFALSFALAWFTCNRRWGAINQVVKLSSPTLACTFCSRRSISISLIHFLPRSLSRSLALSLSLLLSLSLPPPPFFCALSLISFARARFLTHPLSSLSFPLYYGRYSYYYIGYWEIFPLYFG